MEIDTNFTKADYIFNDIYNSLVVNHNKEFIVQCGDLGQKNLKRLKGILNEEHIQFRIEDNNFVCYLNEKSQKIAKDVYTPEVRMKLKKEEELFIKHFFD